MTRSSSKVVCVNDPNSDGKKIKKICFLTLPTSEGLCVLRCSLFYHELRKNLIKFAMAVTNLDCVSFLFQNFRVVFLIAEY